MGLKSPVDQMDQVSKKQPFTTRWSSRLWFSSGIEELPAWASLMFKVDVGLINPSLKNGGVSNLVAATHHRLMNQPGLWNQGRIICELSWLLKFFMFFYCKPILFHGKNTMFWKIMSFSESREPRKILWFIINSRSIFPDLHGPMRGGGYHFYPWRWNCSSRPTAKLT